jgi:signal transduction histidine kinase
VAAAYPLAAIKAAIQRVNLAVTGSLVLAGLGIAVSLFVGFDRLVIRPIRQLEEKLRAVANGRRLADLRLEGSDEIASSRPRWTRWPTASSPTRPSSSARTASSTASPRPSATTCAHRCAPSHDRRLDRGRWRAAAGRVLAHLDRLRDQVARMERMLQDLLHYAQASQVTGPLGPCDIRALVTEQLELLAPSEDGEAQLDGELPTLFTPEPPLALVLRNLIDNAISITTATRSGCMSASLVHGQRVVFRVSDDGPGITPEEQERIFDSSIGPAGAPAPTRRLRHRPRTGSPHHPAAGRPMEVESAGTAAAPPSSSTGRSTAPCCRRWQARARPSGPAA